MKCNHSSFKNELTFALITSTYQYIKRLKREDSGLKSLHFSFKMFNLSLFFFKYLCSSNPADLDQNIWPIIFKWIVSHEMPIGKLSPVLRWRGRKFWITPYYGSTNPYFTSLAPMTPSKPALRDMVCLRKTAVWNVKFQILLTSSKIDIFRYVFLLVLKFRALSI